MTRDRSGSNCHFPATARKGADLLLKRGKRLSHHHGPAVFAICSDCGNVDELDGASRVRKLHRNATRHGSRVEGAADKLPNLKVHRKNPPT